MEGVLRYPPDSDFFKLSKIVHLLVQANESSVYLR